MIVTSHPWLDIFIGTVVSVVSSILNAAGLNLLKLDHVRNRALAMERQRQDCSRPRWLIGLALYLVSQIFGSTIALNFLKTQWIAPLGSLALIFNFVFAKILVGTRITRQDILGTFMVMASVVWIVTFGGMNSAGADVENSLTILELKALFSRILFILYFSILNLAIIAVLSLGTYAYWTITLDESHLDPNTERLIRRKMKLKLTALLGKGRFARASGLTLHEDEEQDDVVIEEREMAARDTRMRKVVAMIMATCGGLLASQTLLLAKSGIKLITSSIPGASMGGAGTPRALLGDQNHKSPFQDPLSFLILFLLILTAVFQVLCLNTALKLYDSVLVVPLFYGFYTTFGLINSIIYLNQFSDYQPWVLLLIILGIALLILGVRMLSSPKPEIQDPEVGSFDEEQQLDCLGGPESHPKDERANQLSVQSTSANSLHCTVSEDEDVKPLQGVCNRDGAYEGQGRLTTEGWKQLAPLRIDNLAGSTNPSRSAVFTRGRSETRRGPSSPSARQSCSPALRPMSPSEFRAQYTNSPFPIRPKHLQDGMPGLDGSRPSSPRAWDEETGGQGLLSAQRGHSPKWLTGTAKIDPVFEDLNPFKKYRRNSTDGSVNLRSQGNGDNIGELHARGRRTSLSRLPSEWDEAAANRRLKHSTLFGEHGSRQSSRSSSPAVSQYSTPSHSRRQSTTADLAGETDASTWRSTGSLDPVPKELNRDCYSLTCQQQQQQRQLRSTTLPQPSPVASIRTHGRQLSFTTKNDGRGRSGSSSNGMAAALSSVGISVTGPSTFTSGAFGSACGTFGPPSKNRAFSSNVLETSQSSGSDDNSQSSILPLSVQLQLQQISQLQHYPTSQLQHSITTSSISTIESTMHSSHNTNNTYNRNNNDYLSSDNLLTSSEFSTETSLAQFLAPGMTPPQLLPGMVGHVDSDDEHGSLD